MRIGEVDIRERNLSTVAECGDACVFSDVAQGVCQNRIDERRVVGAGHGDGDGLCYRLTFTIINLDVECLDSSLAFGEKVCRCVWQAVGPGDRAVWRGRQLTDRQGQAAAQ